jgi:probable HAF family extracellular repeat protein
MTRALAFLIAALPAAAAAQPLYTTTDLFSLYSNSCSPQFYGMDGFSINAHGDVVGMFSCNDDDNALVFVYNHRQGTAKILPLDGGPDPTPSVINNDGEVVGTYEGGDGAAFVYNQGKVFNNIVPWQSAATDVNNRGVVVGWSAGHAFKWFNGTMTDLNARVGNGQSSYAWAINLRGDIVGGSDVLGSFLLKPTGHVIQLGAISPVAINLYDEIIGYIILPDGTTYHAKLWAGGHITDLGTLPGMTSSYAAWINNSGQVVGTTTNGTTSTAVLWQNGKMYNLNTLVGSTDPAYGTVRLQGAMGINNGGQIVANGQYTAGPNRGFYTALILSPAEPVRVSDARGR